MDRCRVVVGLAEGLAAEDLARRLLSELTDSPPVAYEFTRRCRTCGGGHGKPHVLDAPYAVSWSRSAGMLAVAVTHGEPVGVDLEQESRTGFRGFDGVVLSPGETATDDTERARVWTRKEAVLKATGHGLAVDPRSVTVSSPRSRAALVDGPDAAAPIQLHDVPAPGGFACAVAVISQVPVDVRTIDLRR